MNMMGQDEPGQGEGVRLIGLALALYRNPAYAVGITQASELPRGMEFLLQVANGNDEPLALAVRETHAGEAELKQAAIRFIEQVSFGAGGDPYRVLGLNPLATPEEVKEHYHQLIRLFHPDRGIAGHAAADEYSARINQAYTSIRKQAPSTFAERTVHRSPPKPSAAATPKRPGTFSVPTRYAAPPESLLRFDALLAGLTPQRIWGAIAVAAMLFVGVVYLANQGSVPDAADATVVATSEPAVPKLTITEGNKLDRLLAEVAVPVAPAPPSQLPAASSDPKPVSAPPAKQQTEVIPQKKVPEAAKPPAALRPVVTPAPPVQTANKAGIVAAAPSAPSAPVIEAAPRNPQPDTPKKESVAATVAIAAEPAAANTQKAPVPEKVPVAAAAAPVSVAFKPVAAVAAQAEPTDDELFRVVAQFVGSYNQGDLEGFMNLIDDNIRTDEPDGKAGLRKAYGRLFSNSATREILLKNLHWQRNGKLAVGLTEYNVTVSRPGEPAAKVFTGSLRIEVAKLDGRSMISGFYNRPDKK